MTTCLPPASVLANHVFADLEKIMVPDSYSDSDECNEWDEADESTVGDFPQTVLPQMVVAVDIDDTLLQTVNIFKKWVDSQNGGQLLPNWLAYQNELQQPSSQWSGAFVQSGLFEDLPPVPGAKNGLKTLQDAGFRLEAMTARPESMRDVTMMSLDALFPDMFSRVDFTGPPGPGLKGALCKRNGVHVLVDDSIPQLEDASQHGVGCILFDFQGSYGTSRNPSLGVTRLTSWKDISQWIIDNRQFLTDDGLRGA
jgi:phosphoglycolate phosphatase-like HAD superfamily hydrolase